MSVINIDEELINNVYQYEILYDISHQYYYDVVRKENAWEEIAENLSLPDRGNKKFQFIYALFQVTIFYILFLLKINFYYSKLYAIVAFLFYVLF